MERKHIKIKLNDNTSLVAECSADPLYPSEIYIGIESQGVWIQDLAIVRSKLNYDNGDISADNDNFEVLVYADKDDEDYTHKFCIERYEEEEIKI